VETGLHRLKTRPAASLLTARLDSSLLSVFNEDGLVDWSILTARAPRAQSFVIRCEKQPEKQ